MADTYYFVAGKPTIDKDPDAVLDYPQQWGDWLKANAPEDSIASHQVLPDAGIHLDSSTQDGSIVTAWLSGGTAGVTYRVTYRIVTTAGRIDDRSIFVKVKER